jgi:hypothetical protein
VETENPSACVTVNWEVSESALQLVLIVILKTCDEGANKSNHPM